MTRTILYDSEDGDADKLDGGQQRTIVLSTSWDTGVKEIIFLTMSAHPKAGYSAVIQQLNAQGESARIVLHEDELQMLAEELTRWIRRHKTPASGNDM